MKKTISQIHTMTFLPWLGTKQQLYWFKVLIDNFRTY